MSDYEVRPEEGAAVDGWQYGWEMVSERWTYSATTGGTGACWNVGLDDDLVHICDLDSFIAALVALRNSPAYTANEERWR